MTRFKIFASAFTISGLVVVMPSPEARAATSATPLAQQQTHATSSRLAIG